MGGSYVSEARSWKNTPSCVADGGQDMAAAFTPRGRGRLPVIGGSGIWLAHWLTRKLAEGHSPYCPFGKLPLWRCYNLSIRTITSWGGSKYVGMWVGCRWSRHWSSRGCTKSKRTTILGGLIIHLLTMRDEWKLLVFSKLVVCMWWVSMV